MKKTGTVIWRVDKTDMLYAMFSGVASAQFFIACLRRFWIWMSLAYAGSDDRISLKGMRYLA